MKIIQVINFNICKNLLQEVSVSLSVFNIYVMTPPPHISSYILYKVIIRMHETYWSYDD